MALTLGAVQTPWPSGSGGGLAASGIARWLLQACEGKLAPVGELGLGGPLGLELFDGVECLVESESGSRSKSWSGSDMLLRGPVTPDSDPLTRAMRRRACS